MSSSGRGRFLVRRPKVVDVGCSCRGTKLSSLFTFHLPKWKPKPGYALTHHHHNPLSSYYAPSSSTTTAATSPWAVTSHHASSSLSTTTTSLYGEDTPSSYSHSTWARNEKEAGTPKKKKKKKPTRDAIAGGKGSTWAGDSVAVEKDSEDPYLDFRESMLQMILEKEIYAWADVLELLNSFLALNAPCHHDFILRAFAEIWSGFLSSSNPASSSSSCTAGAAMHSQQDGRPCRRHHGAGGRRQRQLPLT